jgi:hypothetical protein
MINTIMEIFYAAIIRFREVRPPVDSPLMLEMINDIIRAYDEIRNLELFELESRRRFQLSMLTGAMKIKRLAADGDLDALSRSLFLYGESLFNP